MEAIHDSAHPLNGYGKLHAQFLGSDMFHLAFQRKNSVAELHVHRILMQVNASLSLQGSAYLFQDSASL
jgi:hypothetical protein